MHKKHSEKWIKCRFLGLMPDNSKLISLGASQKSVFLTSTKTDSDANGPGTMLQGHRF